MFRATRITKREGAISGGSNSAQQLNIWSDTGSLHSLIKDHSCHKNSKRPSKLKWFALKFVFFEMWKSSLWIWISPTITALVIAFPPFQWNDLCPTTAKRITKGAKEIPMGGDFSDSIQKWNSRLCQGQHIGSRFHTCLRQHCSKAQDPVKWMKNTRSKRIWF